jgi:hypothetical protein
MGQSLLDAFGAADEAEFEKVRAVFMPTLCCALSFCALSFCASWH